MSAIAGPQAGFAERMLVAGALRDPDVVVAADLAREDFHVPQASRLWSSMQWHAVTNRRWRHPSEVLLAAADGSPQGAEDLYAWLEGARPNRDDAMHYAEQVRSASLTRQVLTTVAGASKLVEQDIVGTDLVGRLVESLLDLQTRQTRATSRQLSDLVRECAQRILDGRKEGATSTSLDSIPTGLTRIDRGIGGGWQRGVVSVVGARTSHGKSAYLLQCALHAAKLGRRVHLLSAEDLESDTAFRAACRATEIALPALRSGEIDIEQERRVRAAANGEFGDEFGAITLTQVAGKTYEQICALSRILPSDLVMVDYLQRIHVPKGATRYETFTAAMNAFDTVAKQTGSAWVVASQFKRSESEYPQLSDLREAGTIEEIAKCVVGLYRPGKDSARDDRMWVGVLKASNDALANGEFAWDGEKVSILNREVGRW